MKKIFIVLLLFFSITCFAFQKSEIMVRSNCMNKNVPVTVILPDSYSQSEKFPVVYILHGHGGNNLDWLNKTVAAQFSDIYNCIIVLPDGAIGSWYFDSPIDPTFKYETFISSELINYIDSNYKSIPNKAARAITGNSMGGHGAMYLAIRHQDVFGAVGSTAGGVDFRPFPNKWDIKKRLGTIEEYPENWEKNTVINMVDQIKPNSLEMIIDCGVDDFFYQVNLDLHKKLADAKIPHDFISRPGVHNWEYWNRAIPYQLLFFSNYFKKATN